MKIFAERIKDLREEEKLSTRQLAEILGTTNSTVSRWERNICEPGVSMLTKIANYFKVSTDFLCGLED